MPLKIGQEMLRDLSRVQKNGGQRFVPIKAGETLAPFASQHPLLIYATVNLASVVNFDGDLSGSVKD